MNKETQRKIEKSLFRGVDFHDYKAEIKVKMIKSKRKQRISMLLFNILAISLFTYSILSGLSYLSSGWLIGLVVVFSVNMLLIGWQIRQLGQLLDHYVTHHANRLTNQN
jgi:uncharacterized membrane protein